jgi:hypothetical protein
MKTETHPNWPFPPQGTTERLMHVLDVYEDSPDDMQVIRATGNTYAKHPDPDSWTGLTLGDLRAIAEALASGELAKAAAKRAGSV